MKASRGLVMIGHHASVGSEGNSLAHTLNTRTHMITAERQAGFRILALRALGIASLGVPIVFVSGDKALMEEVEQTNPHIGRLAVKEGRGQSTISMTPVAAQNAIRAGVEKSLRGKLKDCLLQVPGHIHAGRDLCEPGAGLRKKFLSRVAIHRQSHQPC